MRVIHVFPCPAHMEPEDALAELVTFGRFVEYSRWSRRWARRRISWYALELDEPDELDP